MSRFNAEFSRLYLVQDPALPAQGHLVSRDGLVKAMVLELARPADWHVLSGVWQAAQNVLALPAAAIAVSGTDGLQLWFSVAEPVLAADATDFLVALHATYLPALPAKRVSVYPSRPAADAPGVVHVRSVPAQQAHTGNWSAFVSPDLAAVFGDEPWLDIAPQRDQQADILARLTSIKLQQFREVLAHLRATPMAPATTWAMEGRPGEAGVPAVGNAGALGPHAFLLQVMNDPAVALQDRIEAAKALLPYVR
jgi:hypothetical protein